MVGLYEPLDVRDKSLGQGMELKVFWGILYARGYRELHSDSLDPDGCLVRSSDFDTHKNNEITGAKQKRQVYHGEHNANKLDFL